MPLLDDLATVLGGQVADLEDALGDRIVEDNLNGGALRTVLLCESPHNTEISHGHPLAGSSGTTVTRAFACHNLGGFVGKDEPVGCLLQSLPQNHRILNSLGLMNVSRLPLQMEAYCHAVRENYITLLSYFKKIKDLDKLDSDRGLRYIQNLNGVPLQVFTAIREDLVDRLPQGEGVKIVTCGNVAKTFLSWAVQNGGNPNCMMQEVSVGHPARGWHPPGKNNQKQRYDPRIRTLVDTICERAMNNVA